MTTPAERIAKCRSGMPSKYRPLYDRCISGEASPQEAVKMQCLQCWGWSQGQTANCDNYACPLFSYRPHRRKAPSEVPKRATSAVQASNSVKEKVLYGQSGRKS